MPFHFYTNAISQASRRVAAGIFIVGLLLIGFGFLIYALRELFAILFAIIFCAAGIGCAITSVKIFWTLRRIEKINSDGSDAYRRNVRIHSEEYNDM